METIFKEELQIACTITSSDFVNYYSSLLRLLLSSLTSHPTIPFLSFHPTEVTLFRYSLLNIQSNSQIDPQDTLPVTPCNKYNTHTALPPTTTLNAIRLRLYQILLIPLLQTRNPHRRRAISISCTTPTTFPGIPIISGKGSSLTNNRRPVIVRFGAPLLLGS